ncbi:MAG: RNA 3'-terminal phosphate cyclase, partial [Candidatus Bathyarchaeia archaeon]
MGSPLVEVDGSMMEGGGQILRMAVTYSAAIGVPVRIRNIRAKRRPPGLRPQHLTTLRAVSDMCRAEARGLEPDSMEVEFRPRPPKGGKYEFDIGTAGSIGLLLQCVAPVSAFSDSTVTLRVIGGTAVRWSPPVQILDKVVWRALRNMGFVGGITIQREGFYPRGGGIVDVTIDPMREVRPLRADAKGELRRVLGVSTCGRLPRHVADRQARSAQ